MADDDKQMNRRRFFSAAFGELIKPLERRAAPLQRAIKQFREMQEKDQARTPSYTPEPPAPPDVAAPEGSTYSRESRTHYLLRPPGALPEEQFASTCSKCGECV